MYKKESLSNFILLALEKAVDGYAVFKDFIYHPLLERPVNKSQVSLALKRLRDKGLIDFVDDNQLIYRLTERGQQKSLIANLLLPEDSWDGRWRIVIFDIPEKRRITRDVLRQQLKSWGFVSWQQSVWATKKNCTIPLRKFINNVGIKNWVRVIESDNIE